MLYVGISKLFSTHALPGQMQLLRTDEHRPEFRASSHFGTPFATSVTVMLARAGGEDRETPESSLRNIVISAGAEIPNFTRFPRTATTVIDTSWDGNAIASPVLRVKTSILLFLIHGGSTSPRFSPPLTRDGVNLARIHFTFLSAGLLVDA